ncbi:MAG: trypsin-like peptidase domain-containing protein [Pseudotabrizicola sp.]|uniref:trypsin-like peptidase domain-containing protein n=1 Tax=Pseudotabrizicola sp. TaxID=2939647 RepID=UPI0027316101|nr:trypsin-like peptidase domain-containing protein [Pseudotabrizicola sp.]MDP2081919.1 trypsin-like peptidase domain-containing protein [Pseudotabrizicola sp.]MDZ7575991.1 trypsin-like peptidase domain-containing protein [Pseudotabrizicola sp.]
MYLQSDLLRVVSSKVDKDGTPHIELLHGTAFLIGDSGLFLTARHVLEAAQTSKASGCEPVIFAVTEAGKRTTSPILEYELAPNGQDIGIGRTAYRCDSMYRIDTRQHTVWREVLTAGYPEDAFVRDEVGIKTPIRAFKGIVQRLIRPGDLHLAPRSDGFELSFSPSPGMSGAPLCVPGRDGHLSVIGVCVGAFRSEQIEDEYTEVKSDGSRYFERRVRIVQFGLAEALFPLLDWRPSVLNGATLGATLGQSY